MKIGLLLLLLTWNGSGGAQPANTHPFSELNALADRLVAKDRYLGRQRVNVSSSKVVSFDVKPDQAVQVNPADTLLRSLDVLIRYKALLRDLSALFPNETFWDKNLSRIYSDVQDLNSDTAPPSKKAVSEKFGEIESDFQGLEALSLPAVARKHLDVESSREPAVRFKVEVIIEPKAARVRYMPLLTFLRYTMLDSGKFLEAQWVDLEQGTASLIGKYRYRAEWPPDLNGITEGTFEVTEDGKKLTFVPGPPKGGK